MAESRRSCTQAQQSICSSNHLHSPRVSQLLLLSCSFPDMRPATNSFSWYQNSISDGFPGITNKIIEIPAKKLVFPQICVAPGKDAALLEQRVSSRVCSIRMLATAVLALLLVALIIGNAINTGKSLPRRAVLVVLSADDHLQALGVAVATQGNQAFNDSAPFPSVVQPHGRSAWVTLCALHQEPWATLLLDPLVTSMGAYITLCRGSVCCTTQSAQPTRKLSCKKSMRCKRREALSGPPCQHFSSPSCVCQRCRLGLQTFGCPLARSS